MHGLFQNTDCDTFKVAFYMRRLIMPIASEFRGIVRASTGLDIAVLPFEKKSRIYIWLCVRTGSHDSFIPCEGAAPPDTLTINARWQNKVHPFVYRPGLDHAVEHFVFKGTDDPRFRTAAKINDFYAPRNRDDENAHGADTAEIAVRYYVEIEPEDLECSMRFLGALTTRPLVREQKKDPLVWRRLMREWERERKVLLEEKAFGDDDPWLSAIDDTLRRMFPGHPISHTVDGTVEDIRSITLEEIALRHRIRYHPSNMLLIVIGGGVTAGTVKRLAERYIRVLRNDTVHISVPLPPFPELPMEKRVEFSRADTKKLYLALGFPFRRPSTARNENLPESIRHFYSMRVLKKLAGGRWASLPFIELREKRGIGYRHQADLFEFPGAGSLIYSTHIFPEDAHDALRVLLKIYRGLATHLPPRRDFENAKRVLVDELQAAKETPGDLAEYIYRWMRFANTVPMFEDAKKILCAITPEDVLKVTRETFVPARLYATFIGNLPSKCTQRNLLRMLRDWKLTK